MTNEEKARAYDEALDWMRRVYPTLTGAAKEDAEHFFPALKESEDERIRKAIEGTIRVYGKTQGEWIGGYDMDTLVVHLREAFDALERQKDSKVVKFDHDREQKPESDVRVRYKTRKECYLEGLEAGRKEQKSTEWSEEQEEPEYYQHRN